MFFGRDLLPKVVCLALLTALINLCFTEVDLQKGVDVHGFVQMQGGQFINYKYRSTNFSHKWLQGNLLGINIDAHVNSRLDIFLTSGVGVTFNTQKQNMIANPDDFANAPSYGFVMDRAEMVIHCSHDPSAQLLDIGIGLWNEKYNQESRNLGEYLFRSGAYPGYIYQTGFDESFFNLAGIHLTSNLFGMWRNELMLTSEIHTAPFNDFSLAYLTDVSLFKKVFNAGAGIQFFRCFSADPDQTSPKALYKGGVIEPNPAPNYYLGDSLGVDLLGSTFYDTNYYTFAGTKLMGKLAFDPKPLLGFDIFGPEDLKLYSEVAILGLKNYPLSPLRNNPSTGQDFGPDTSYRANGSYRIINKYGFDDLMQKMPIMFGFNVPAFKLLDILSVEFEYYGKKYVNAVPIPLGTRGHGSYNAVPSLPTPLAQGGLSEYDSLIYEKAGAVNWKWSVYAKKTLFNNFTITAQAARDHILNTVRGLSMQEVDNEEALVKKNQWYWMLKFSANF